MITFEQAKTIVASAASSLSTERTPLAKSLRRVLAEDVSSDVDMPPFDKSAMDGFACRIADLERELKIVEEIPAGKAPEVMIGPNQCARIMTGGMVPKGADFVLMKEHVQYLDKSTIRCTQKNTNENICYRGEDVKTGDVVLPAGTLLGPAHLAMLAAVGCNEPVVYKQPRVAIISTGDELVEPDQTPPAGKIRNSNGHQLIAQVSQLGLVADYLGIIPDEKAVLLRTLDAAISNHEAVLITGGVSVGDYDYIPAVLQQLQVDTIFHGMNVKPGKHLVFGKKNQCSVIGMPGNPVSSFVQFEVLVKPLLYKLMGYSGAPLVIQAPLERPYSRKKKDTLFFAPVDITENGAAVPLEYHGSAHIHAYVRAKGIMEVPIGVLAYKTGDKVSVRPL